MDSKQVIKGLGDYIDEKVDFKELIGGVAGQGVEMVDGFVFTQLLKVGYEYTPEADKEDVLKLYDAISREDVEAVKKVLSTKLVSVINTSLGDSLESDLITAVLDVIAKRVIK